MIRKEVTDENHTALNLTTFERWEMCIAENSHTTQCQFSTRWWLVQNREKKVRRLFRRKNIRSVGVRVQLFTWNVYIRTVQGYEFSRERCAPFYTVTVLLNAQEIDWEDSSIQHWLCTNHMYHCQSFQTHRGGKWIILRENEELEEKKERSS